MKKILILPTLFMLFFAGNLVAQQVTLQTPNMNAQPGDNIHLDLQVADFELITGAQFSVNWKSSVLQFIGVDNFGISELTTDGNFGTVEVAEGKLRFAWYQQDVTGVTLPDGTTLFSIWFKVIGNDATSSVVSVTDTPIIIEFVNLAGQIVPVNLVSGTVTVGSANPTSEVHTNDFTLFQNSPNPFRELTNISFNLKQTEYAALSIYDSTGKVIFEKNETFTAGMNTIPVEGSLFQTKGVYFFTLKTAHSTATRQLIMN